MFSKSIAAWLVSLTTVLTLAFPGQVHANLYTLPGATGAAGVNGATWRVGSGAPSNAVGVDNDLYLNSVTSDVYQRAAGAYSIVANIRGTNGTIGANGATWRTGAGAPSNTLGVDNDLYLNSVTSDVYQRAAGAYSIVANIRGATGATGSSGVVAATAPITYNAGTQTVAVNVATATTVGVVKPGPGLSVDGTGTLTATNAGTVTTVTAGPPLASSGGATPNITLTGTVGIGFGGTGAVTAATAFNNLSPLTTPGDTLYGGTAGAGTRLAGNTTTVRKWLRSTGDGTNATAPAWDVFVPGDLPIATTTTLGAVKVGAGLTIDGTGLLSAGAAVLPDPLTHSKGIISTGTGNGTVVGNARGTGANDFETYRSSAANVASGNYSTLSGFDSQASGDESLAIGYGVRASGPYSTAFGSATVASGQGSFAAGEGTQAQAPDSVSLGVNETAARPTSFGLGHGGTAATDDSFALGYRAYTETVGEVAHSAKPFVTYLDTQASEVLLKVATSATTQAELTSDGTAVATSFAGTVNIIPLDASVIYDFDIVLIARDVNGNSAKWTISENVSRPATGAAVVKGSATITAAAWNDAAIGAPVITFPVAGTGDRLQLLVTPANATATRWFARVRDMRLTY